MTDRGGGGRSGGFRLAILDDYGDVSRSSDWSQLDDVEVVAFPDHVEQEDALVQRLLDFDGLVVMRERTPISRAVVERLPRLRLLITTGSRNAVLDVAAARESGIIVCGTGGTTTGTAELTWALLLALARHLPHEDASIRNGGWQTAVGSDLRGKTLGLLGLGRIGVQVATVGHAFGMRIVAWSQNLTSERASSHGVGMVQRDELFQTADFLSIHLVLSERTRNLVGDAELRQMKPTSYLVNTSRGQIVNEHALVRALAEGWISGAGLDVYDVEPLPQHHPLRHAPRTVLTPHIGYVTAENHRIHFEHVIEDVRAYMGGQPIRVIAG